MRTYPLTSGEVGTWFAVANGLGGLLGSYLGGEWATRYAAGNESLQLRVLTIALALCGVLCACVYLVSSYQAAFCLMTLYFLLLTTVNGPVFAVIQTLVPERMRAVAFALVFLFCNLVGMGLGPLAVGVLSDVLRGSAGEESLRYALFATTPGFLVVAWFGWCASRTVGGDLAVAVRRTADLIAEEGAHISRCDERVGQIRVRV